MLNFTRKENECNVEFQLRTSFNNKLIFVKSSNINVKCASLTMRQDMYVTSDVLKEIVNRKSDDEAWQTINSHIRLHHLGTGQALKVGDLYTTPGYRAGS